MSASSDAATRLWYLEGFVDSARETWRTVIRRLPFRVGRDPDSELRLDCLTVSHHHAELFEDEGGLWIHDLASSNGTAVNFETVQEPRRLQDGDLIHFADLQFRLAVCRSREATPKTGTIPLLPQQVHRLMAEDGRRLRELIDNEAVTPVFQPLVRFDNQQVVGFELLSRGRVEDLETSPAELFYIAEKLGLEAELSTVCRRRGVRTAGLLPGDPWVFVNTHPSELRQESRLIDSLAALRRGHDSVRIVLEIHEAAITDVGRIREFHKAVRDLGCLIAFDDFGTGRSRLLEIATEPPDFLKFDVRLIRKLESAGRRRRKVVASLVGMADSLGITTIAEGVETKDEAEACLATGFDAGQGFYLGRPAPARSLETAETLV